MWLPIAQSDSFWSCPFLSLVNTYLLFSTKNDWILRGFSVLSFLALYWTNLIQINHLSDDKYTDNHHQSPYSFDLLKRKKRQKMATATAKEVGTGTEGSRIGQLFRTLLKKDKDPNKDRDEPIIVNKWDAANVKNTLDDTVKKLIKDNYGWEERHTLANGRLVISFLAVVIAGFALLYDYMFPFPKSKIILAVCSISYFVIIMFLQLYQWYVEKLTFFQAVEKAEKDSSPPRYWKWSSDMKRYDDKYVLIAEYSQGSRSGSMKVVKSVASYITEDGEVLVPLVKKEVDSLKKNLLKSD